MEAVDLEKLVPMEGIEPPTLALRKPCSTPELHRQQLKISA